MVLRERGSAVVYILVGIALFGALASSFLRGSQSGQGNLSAGQAKLAAQEIFSYGQTLERAVGRLRQRGCSETQISFENASDPNYINPNAPPDKSCHVFEPQGGGVSWQTGEGTVFNGYYIMGHAAITDLGTAATELILYGEPPLATCEEINRIAGGANKPEPEHIANVAYPPAYNAVKFKGSYWADGLIAETAPGPGVYEISVWRAGKRFACALRPDFITNGGILAPPDKAYEFYFTLLYR